MLRTLRTQVKWILVFFLLVFVLAIPLMYGVGGGKKKDSSQNGNADYVVAEIDGKDITRRTLLEAVQGYVDRAGIKDVTSADLPMIRKMVLDQMVMRVALEKEVKALGIKPSAEDVDKSIKQISNQFPTKEAFQQYMTNSGVTEAKLREQISSQLAEQMLLNEASAAAAVEEKELSELYDSVKDLVFTVPAGVDLLVAEFSNKDAADSAYADLTSGGSWDVVMAGFTSSDIKSSTSSDKAVFVRETALTDKLAFIVSMDDGQYAEPVEVASDDYLLVFHKEGKEKSTIPFEEAKDRLKEMVLSQKKQQLQQAFMDEISAKVKLNILDPSIFPEEEEVVEVVSIDETVSPDTSVSEDK